MKHKMKRKSLIPLVTIVALASCAAPQTASLPVSSPANSHMKLAFKGTSPIQHVIIIFQENRTPDNLFQSPTLIAEGATIAQSGPIPWAKRYNCSRNL